MWGWQSPPFYLSLQRQLLRFWLMNARIGTTVTRQESNIVHSSKCLACFWTAPTMFLGRSKQIQVEIAWTNAREQKTANRPIIIWRRIKRWWAVTWSMATNGQMHLCWWTRRTQLTTSLRYYSESIIESFAVNESPLGRNHPEPWHLEAVRPVWLPTSF